MTKFLCQELLYEYLSGSLDERRCADIENYLSTCRESQRELDRLKRGIEYGHKALQVRVSQPLHEALMNFEPQWRKTLRQWNLMSSQRGWRLLPYVFVSATLVTGLFALKPWNRLPSNEAVLAEQAGMATSMEPRELPADAPVEVEAIPGLIPQIQPSQSVSAPTSEEAEERVNEAPLANTGLLNKARMEVTGFADAWPAIKDKIAALGGKAASSVELGTLKTPSEAVFHFSLPESNLNELNTFLGSFGPVRFTTEKASRVMPEGKIRIMLMVKDAAPESISSDAEHQDEAPAETP